MDRLDYFTTGRTKAKYQSRFTRGVAVFNRWRIFLLWAWRSVVDWAEGWHMGLGPCISVLCVDVVWKFISIYKRTSLRNTTIIFVQHSISADCFGWELNPLQVTLKDVAADTPISITNPTQVILSARGSAFAYACVTHRKNVQTDRPLGNLIHYSTYDHTVPLLGHVLSFHCMLQCVGMHVVSCLSVHTDTHPSAHLASTEHGGRVLVSCFHSGRSWLKISV